MTIRKMKLKRILGLAFFLCAMVAAVENIYGKMLGGTGR